ncbi:MAG: restriction endonuclease subunit S [Armatimonadia bacterium]
MKRPFRELLQVPLRNGLNRPRAVRGSGVPMVNMGELFAHDRIGNVAMERVPFSDSEAGAYLLAPGDLLFARQSLVLSGAGKCSVFMGAAEPTTYEGHIIRARLDPEVADPLYYFYYFRSPRGRGVIESIVEQVAAAGIRGSDLAGLMVDAPPTSQQRAIAHVLGSLDDKIELNRRMNETLEAMARAIFKSWFVDFDPVRAKAEGRQPAGMDAATAALFPDEFEETEFGEVPKGWGVQRLGDIIELAYGKALKAESRNAGEIPVFGSNGQSGWHDEPMFNGPGIVVGRKGANAGSVSWSRGPHCVIDTAFHVVTRLPELGPHFLFRLLAAAQLEAQVGDSAIPGLNRNIAYMTRVFLPPVPVAAAFGQLAESLDALKGANEAEARTLAAIRDTLLPRLLCGELRIDDPEVFLVRATADVGADIQSA